MTSPPTQARASHMTGILLMLASVCGSSTGGLFVRMTEAASAWELVLWRSVFMMILVTAVLAVWHKGRVIGPIIATGWAGVACGAFLGTTFFCFLFALKFTTVANTHVIMGTTPFVAALVAWLVLGERVQRATLIAITMGVVGIVIMFWDSLATGKGLIGNLFAFGVALAMAFNLMLLRRQVGRVDMVPSVMYAGLFSSLLALPFAWPIATSSHDLLVIAGLGVVQLGIPLLLMTTAARHLSAAEVAFFLLLEVILAPAYVWLAFGEQPSVWALIGGLIVLVSLAVNILFSERRATAT